jgi:3-deoxy-D-arabino-heptulosonate 7-phosphate (DAHP) synthase
MMEVHISEMAWLHTAETRLYCTYHNVYQALKKMLIDAFEDQYLNALSDEIVGYANCTSLQLLSHLLTYNAMIAPAELTQNYERLNTLYDPNQENCVNTDADLDNGIKTNCIYAATIDARQIYTDQTGRFPVVSSKGNRYIMVLYEYDGNAILAEPIKNHTAAELLRAFQVMEKQLSARGLQPKLMRLDNEASQLLKSYLHEQDITFQLVPPYNHRRNAAERAIRSFKDHLSAGL